MEVKGGWRVIRASDACCCWLQCLWQSEEAPLSARSRDTQGEQLLTHQPLKQVIQLPTLKRVLLYEEGGVLFLVGAVLVPGPASPV